MIPMFRLGANASFGKAHSMKVIVVREFDLSREKGSFM